MLQTIVKIDAKCYFILYQLKNDILIFKVINTISIYLLFMRNSRPRRRSGSSIVVLGDDDEKRPPPDDDKDMLTMLSLTSDTGKHNINTFT